MRSFSWLKNWVAAFAFLFLGAACGSKYSFDQLGAERLSVNQSPDASNRAPDKCKPGSSSPGNVDSDDDDDDYDTDRDGQPDCDDDDDDNDGTDDDDDDDSDGDGVADVSECAAV